MKKRPGPRRKPRPTGRAPETPARLGIPPSQRLRPNREASLEIPERASIRKPQATRDGNRRRPPRLEEQPPEPVVHVASAELIASVAVSTAEEVERSVLVEKKRADRAISAVLRRHRGLGPADQRFVAEAVYALFRWKGWVDRLNERRMEARLFASCLLESTNLHPACRFWAKRLGIDPDRMIPLGDAPGWTALAEGFKRSLASPTFSADPWALFPPLLRDHLPRTAPSGDRKKHNLAILAGLQKRPSLWVRVQHEAPEKVWDELRALGLQPWIHRTILHAAKLPMEADVNHLPPFLRGSLEIQDLASQLVGLACDPEPGERWWDACAGAGGKSLHLASLMKGKGVVVATDVNEYRLKELVKRCRRSPFRNVSSKLWVGKQPAGKPKSFDGVLVDAPCSAIGTWRRNPDARWTLDTDAIARLSELQGQLLVSASAGVKPGGALVYSVCTFTPEETTSVLKRFLESHSDFQLDPFPNPISKELTDGTLQILPQDADSDAMFVARMIRTTSTPSSPTITA